MRRDERLPPAHGRGGLKEVVPLLGVALFAGKGSWDLALETVPIAATEYAMCNKSRSGTRGLPWVSDRLLTHTTTQVARISAVTSNGNCCSWRMTVLGQCYPHPVCL